MKRWLLSVMLLTCVVGFSQTPFQRIYPSQYGFVGKLLTPTLDHGYFFLHQEAYGYITHFVKTDSTGDVQWSVELNLRHIQDILPEIDGSYVIIGSKHFIRIDPMGHILWQYTYKYDDIAFHKIKKDVHGDGYFIVASVSDGWVVLKLDNSGDTVWMKRLNKSNVIGYDLVQSENDLCIYVVGLGATINDSFVLLSKLTDNGKHIWTKEFARISGLLSIEGVTIKRTIQDRFLMGIETRNGLQLMSIDTGGTITNPVEKLTYSYRCIWKWDLAEPGKNNSIFFSILTEPYILYPVSRHIIVGKTNVDGSISWVKQLGVKNREHVDDIKAEGLHITMLATNYDTLTKKSYVKLIKSDASHTFCDAKDFPYPAVSHATETSKLDTVKFTTGIITRVQTTDLVTVSLNTPSYLACYESELSSIDGIVIYPNPFDWQTTIAFENVQYQSSIQVFNVMGLLIMEQEFTGKQLTLQLPGLRQGIYFIRITDSAARSVIKKVMVQ